MAKKIVKPWGKSPLKGKKKDKIIHELKIKN